MKKIVLLTAVFIMGLALSMPTNARGRQNVGTTTGAQTQNRPGSPQSSTPGNNSQAKPSTPNNGPGGNNFNSGGASQRPGNPNVQPPSTPPPNGGGPSRPNTPPSSTQPPRPGYYDPGYSYRPPMPHTPPTFTYTRPTPPPSWRPTYNSPYFNTILGVALGTYLSNSVMSWYNGGYNVTGYTNNEVYLSNVEFLNISWPNATMYYRNGILKGSLFSAATYSYDPTRYNYAYSMLTSRYGMPVTSQVLSGGGMSSTWWGYNNTYLTLSFYPETTYGYGTRYYTTLSTGY